MRVLDPGHIYKLEQLGTDEKFTLTFIKRSGGAIQYAEEWPGLQTQEVLRALIDRTKHLQNILPCLETGDALEGMRVALWAYEARAYRRKMSKVNRLAPQQMDQDRTYDDIPFTHEGIEYWPIDPGDGHIDLRYVTPENMYVLAILTKDERRYGDTVDIEQFTAMEMLERTNMLWEQVPNPPGPRSGTPNWKKALKRPWRSRWASFVLKWCVRTYPIRKRLGLVH